MTNPENLENALDRLAAGESPLEDATGLNRDERRMLQMAQLMSGARGVEGPGNSFKARLGARLAQPEKRGIPRRAALLSSLGAMAAGIAAGFGIDRLTSETATAERHYEPLVGPDGHWADVMLDGDLPEGGVKAFTADAVTGFVMRSNGEIRALSAVCTHMGCILRFHSTSRGLVCPCHGAEFDLAGYMTRYPGWKTVLPPLPKLKVRVKDASIQVWTA